MHLPKVSQSHVEGCSDQKPISELIQIVCICIFKGCRPCRRPRKNWQAVRTYIWYRPAPPPQKKWGKDVSGTVLHALLPVMVFMLKGNVRSVNFRNSLLLRY